ncbi:MAG: T9SS type A sorting domain-containing protein [Saprospiraceae bacterium]|nr:T9SS type A sorting domain-containing protein [Saprospiraceae bacterium]
MRILYTLTILLAFTAVRSQISMTPSTLSVIVSEEIPEYVYNITVTNSASAPTSLWWKVQKAAGFPSAWETYTCDLNQCYLPGLEECPASKPNVIPANTTVSFTYHFDPNGSVGQGKVWFQLYSDKSFKTLVAETDPEGTIIADKTLNTKYTSPSSDLKLFPNPTDDYFIIKNDNGVAKVGIFNIVGKEMVTYRHTPGNSYDVSDLSRGIYIVRLLDNRGKTIKSIRLSKK